MTDNNADIIDLLAGVKPGSRAEALRLRRPVTRAEAQKSWEALFVPADDSAFSLAERFAVATFVAGLHAEPEIAAFYAGRLKNEAGGEALLAAVEAATRTGAGHGPYGHYPAGPLTGEDEDGPVLDIAAADANALDTRLVAAFAHAHLLVFHPRDAAPEALEKLLAAGWTTTGIVTLSQLVSFLAFQIRVIAGLKVLAA